ncbi:hypothetical protein [Candidatus Sororendozoicomonas aggregata]|uniref:hypothetical protein n=1 Tax=Candidatus Sororendozoicomonas aggregata TaxID=3073239 RepID=UPI002ED1F833
MFYVVYLFDVPESEEESFETDWHALTLDIYEKHQSLGSRLHKREEGGYFAYAHWPDRATWQKMWQSDHSENPMQAVYMSLKSVARVVCQGTISDDLLQPLTYRSASQKSDSGKG